MRIRLLLIFFFSLWCFSVSASDTIVKVNGDTIICTIRSQSGRKVEFTGSTGQYQYSGTLPKSEIVEIIQEKPQMSELDSINLFTFGLGLGLDYGGIGLNCSYYPIQTIGITAGVGYALAGIGANAGIRAQTKRGPMSFASFYGQLLYGYNTVIYVFKASSLNKIYYGFTPGAGFDFYLGTQKNAVLSLGINLPLRSSSVDEYISYLEKQQNVKFEKDLSPVAVTLGLRFFITN